MNLDELESAWRSPRNRPTAAELAAERLRFTKELEQKRRGVKLLLCVVFVVLSGLTLRLLAAVLWPEPGHEIALTREWAPLLFLALPWIGVFFLLRRVARHEREHGHPERSLADSVRALLDENRMSRARLKTIATLHAVMLVALPLVVAQLRAVGKAGEEIVLPAFLGWPLVAVGILVAMWWHDRSKLRPRQQQLQALLRDHEAG